MGLKRIKQAIGLTMEQDFCEYCNAALPAEGKLVTVYRHRQGRHFIFERVPAQACPRCGERYSAAAVVREMDRLMQQPNPIARLVSVPVIELSPAV
jgi:YgiT-type zinc finger domain-containing protein